MNPGIGVTAMKGTATVNPARLIEEKINGYEEYRQEK
jgi:hypothetical protein